MSFNNTGIFSMEHTPILSLTSTRISSFFFRIFTCYLHSLATLSGAVFRCNVQKGDKGGLKWLWTWHGWSDRLVWLPHKLLIYWYFLTTIPKVYSEWSQKVKISSERQSNAVKLPHWSDWLETLARPWPLRKPLAKTKLCRMFIIQNSTVENLRRLQEYLSFRATFVRTWLALCSRRD